MTSKRAEFQADRHVRWLRHVQEMPELTQRELTEAVRGNIGGMHYALKILIEKGHVKLGNFTAARDSRRYVCGLTPKHIAREAVLTRAVLVRKMEECKALREDTDKLVPEAGFDTQNGSAPYSALPLSVRETKGRAE